MKSKHVAICMAVVSVVSWASAALATGPPSSTASAAPRRAPWAFITSTGGGDEG